MSSKQKTIQFASNPNPRDLCRFSRDLWALPELEKIVVDVRPWQFAKPVSTLFYATAIRQRSAKHQNEQVVVVGAGGDNMSYPNNFGFSDFVLKNSRRPKRAQGGKSYIPISEMKRCDLESQLYKDPEIAELGDIITLRCDSIARVVSQEQSEEIHRFLQLIFREIFRNAFEHAEVNSVLYMAQYWPANKSVEICIYDAGIGIKESLSASGFHILATDHEAVKMALMPGVSSKAQRQKKKPRHLKSAWDNSGHGLFLSHQLAKRHGVFFLASGETGIVINSQGAYTHDCNVNGTLISMYLNLADYHNIENTIQEVRSKAFEIKQRLGVKSLSFESVEAFLKADRTNK